MRLDGAEGALYRGTVPRWAYVNEDLAKASHDDKGEQVDVTSTPANWVASDETRLYLWLPEGGHVLDVNGTKLEFLWDAGAGSFAQKTAESKQVEGVGEITLEGADAFVVADSAEDVSVPAGAVSVALEVAALQKDSEDEAAAKGAKAALEQAGVSDGDEDEYSDVAVYSVELVYKDKDGNAVAGDGGGRAVKSEGFEEPMTLTFPVKAEEGEGGGARDGRAARIFHLHGGKLYKTYYDTVRDGRVRAVGVDRLSEFVVAVSDKSQAELELEDRTTELADSNARIEGLEGRIADREKEIEELRAELAAAQASQGPGSGATAAQLRAAQAAAERAEAAAAAAQAALEASRAESDAALSESRAELARAEAELAEARAQLGAGGSPAAMHRLYNPNTGEHFYTASDEERDGLRAAGWKVEEDAWTAPASGEAVHRLYNPNAGDHHYTASADEVADLVRAGWSYEGVGWYGASGAGVALLRLYNPNALSGAHHYTADPSERDALVAAGWRAEGVGWYGLA